MLRSAAINLYGAVPTFHKAVKNQGELEMKRPDKFLTSAKLENHVDGSRMAKIMNFQK